MSDDPQSPRLRYRRAATHDVETLHRHWNEREVRRYLWDDAVVALETVVDVVAASSADFARAGYGLWLLCDAAPAIVGTCGLRQLGASTEIEILYSIDPARWGRGLATEAAGAVLTFAFAALGCQRVVGGIDAANLASRRVLEKLGMTGPVTIEGAPAGVDYLVVERQRVAIISA